jgi:hypothetical protein
MSQSKETDIAFVAFFLLILSTLLLLLVWVARYNIGYGAAKTEWVQTCIDKGYLKFGIDEKTGAELSFMVES